MSLVGIDLITVEARVVVASIDTYLKYSEAVGQSSAPAVKAIDTKAHEALLAQNAALSAQITAGRARSSDAAGRARPPDQPGAQSFL